jgi:hypothetical protein
MRSRFFTWDHEIFGKHLVLLMLGLLLDKESTFASVLTGNLDDPWLMACHIEKSLQSLL